MLILSIFRCEVVANYIQLNINPDSEIFEYEVCFDPSIEEKDMRVKLLDLNIKMFGSASIFDGATLYLPCQLPNQVFLLLNYLKTIFHF